MKTFWYPVLSCHSDATTATQELWNMVQSNPSRAHSVVVPAESMETKVRRMSGLQTTATDSFIDIHRLHRIIHSGNYDKQTHEVHTSLGHSMELIWKNWPGLRLDAWYIYTSSSKYEPIRNESSASSSPGALRELKIRHVIMEFVMWRKLLKAWMLAQ